MNYLPPIILRQGFAQSASPIGDNGLAPQNRDVRVTVRTTVTAGEVLMFDMAQSDGDVASATIGASDSCWNNVINPTAAGLAAGYPLCVAPAAITDNASGIVRVQGVVSAQLAGTNVIGDKLVATTAGTLARTLDNTDQRVVGWALVAGATAQNVYFDGLSGGMGAVQNPLPVGIQIPNIDVSVTARKTVGAGELVMFDMDQGDGDVSTADLGATTSCWANVIAPTDAHGQHGFPMAVALAAITDNAVGTVRLEGIVDADVTGTMVIGDHLVANTDGTLNKTTTVSDTYYAIALVAGTTTQSVWFRGLHGFGTTPA